MSIFFKIKEIKNTLKWRCQRFMRGYADVDVWNIDSWFVKTMAPMLKQFRENSISHPSTYSLNEAADYLGQQNWHVTSDKEGAAIWQAIIQRLEDALVEMGKDPLAEVDFSMSNEEVQQAIDLALDKQTQAKNEFFKTFSAVFYDLWD